MNRLVSIIIVNFNGKEHLEKCLPSLYEQDYKNIEVILVDNGSTDGSLEFIKKKYPKIKLVKNNSNLGFAEANNQGYRISKGGFVLFLNNDTKVKKDFLTQLLVGYKDERVAGLQSKILLMDKKDTLDVAGSYFTWTGFLFHYGYLQKDSDMFDHSNYLYSAKGACMIFRKDVLEKVKVNDEIFDSDYYAYFEESDLCHRVWLAGYKIKLQPNSVIYHKVGATSSKLDNSFVQFHSFKNKFCTYIKNLEFKSLIVVLPLHLIISYIGAILYLFQLKLSMFMAVNNALYWNVINIRRTLNKRKVVQSEIRKVRDKEVFEYVMKNPDIFYYIHLFTDLKKYNYKELT